MKLDSSEVSGKDLFKKCLSKKTPVFLAPMAGVTDAPFREMVESFGATAVVSEMVSSESLVRFSKKTYRRIADKNDKYLKIVQLVGFDPKNMAESAIINEDLGADIVDINMGCPARKIVSNDSGAALMTNEDLAVKIVDAVVKAVKIPVTVKIRLGWDNEHINCISLAKKFEEAGIQMIAIHCRTRNQMYSGNANWSLINELRDVIRIPYLCNGDIKTGEDAVCAIEKSNATGVMIGRAALGKPWLLNQIMKFFDTHEVIQSPSLEEQFCIVMKHFYTVLDFYGELQGIRVFRKHFCWYSTGLSGASRFRETINSADDISFIKNCVESFYEGCSKAAL
ncbi:MAG: tRNA dihydrouridine synthase DusB [Holosporaceae bacterium]|jgi:tRNA-dihydrouridine synthase B|nr:tRNA dihydrouridine synthase DusB [Holosporaceae bacterium]